MALIYVVFLAKRPQNASFTGNNIRDSNTEAGREQVSVDKLLAFREEFACHIRATLVPDDVNQTALLVSD